MGVARADLLECARVIAGMLGEDDVDEVLERLSLRLASNGQSLADLEEVEAEAFDFFLRRNGERLRFLQGIALLHDELPVRDASRAPSQQRTGAVVQPEHALPCG